jgi:hypothetical protein
MCVIPYGTQEGEISFCAYNTGAGWRQVIENIYMTANTAEWYKEEGRHTVYASQKKVPLPEVDLKVIRVDEIQVVGQDGDGRRPAADGSGLEGHPVGALPGPSRQAR